MIIGVSHTAFVIGDMEASLQFYCDVLGFEHKFEMQKPDSGEPWIVYLKIKEGQFLELFYGGEKVVDVDMSTVGYNHLCLEVDDIHEIANHLKNNNIVLDKEPKQGLDLNMQCWARDPDGNRIEFMQYHPACPQLN